MNELVRDRQLQLAIAPLIARQHIAVDIERARMNGDLIPLELETPEGKPGQKRRHAGNIAIILACLIGTAQVYLLDQVSIEMVALDEAADDIRGQIVRPHGRQHAAQGTDGRADRVYNHYFSRMVIHGTLFTILTLAVGRDVGWPPAENAASPLRPGAGVTARASGV